MAGIYKRRLEKLEPRPGHQHQLEGVCLRLMRYEIERRSLGWMEDSDDMEEVKRAWEAIQQHPKFAEMDAAVRSGEWLFCQSTVGR